MTIDGLQKVTLLDYPNHIACIIFTRGCNYACSYCQNSSLIHATKEEGLIKEEEVLKYLEKRRNILEGIVISGGEATLQKDLKEFCAKAKSLGYKLKLDTNGSNPKVLKDLIDNNLLDYVAMDIKNSTEKYEIITKCKVNINMIKESINILKNSNIDYEFRTTIIKEYHSLEDIINIAKMVGSSKYYIQNFNQSDDVIDKTLHGFTDIELINIKKILSSAGINIDIRGIKNENLIQKEEERVCTR